MGENASSAARRGWGRLPRRTLTAAVVMALLAALPSGAVGEPDPTYVDDADGRSVCMNAAFGLLDDDDPITGEGLIRGTDGDDVILGSPGRDIILAGDGDDVVCGGGGRDLIIGGDGDDLLGSDMTAAPAAADLAEPPAGDATMIGGDGDDQCIRSDGGRALQCETRNTPYDCSLLPHSYLNVPEGEAIVFPLFGPPGTVHTVSVEYDLLRDRIFDARITLVDPDGPDITLLDTTLAAPAGPNSYETTIVTDGLDPGSYSIRFQFHCGPIGDDDPNAAVLEDVYASLFVTHP